MNTWNDSLSGHFLWSNVNFGEAVSEVMTPFTWSMLRLFRQQWATMKGLAPFGNIGGRLYFNASYIASALHAAGQDQGQIRTALQAALHMPIPAEIEIPVASLNPLEKFIFLFKSAAEQTRWAISVQTLPAQLAGNLEWCRLTRRAIEACSTPSELAELWPRRIRSHLLRLYIGVLSSAMRYTGLAGPLRRELAALVGAEQADVLTASTRASGEMLASLGPTIGLHQLSQGQISLQQFQEAYGHRGSNEWEVFSSRLADDPHRLQDQLAGFRQSVVDVDQMLSQQQSKFKAAWQQLGKSHPTQAGRLRARIAAAASRCRLREAARSELVRVIWVLSSWATRAGEMSSLGRRVAFLEIDETVSLLNGDATQPGKISGRQAAYERYAALPPYPDTILGQFDPIAWAADPHRPPDLLSGGPQLPGADHYQPIMGSPGSAGIVEGTVRVIACLEKAGDLQPGEILVTAFTDIGWTPYFPHLAAIITDVGAALSHAAIVARELGIPAVVGCGDATRRLHTGDRVRVDGGQGTVQVLCRST